MKTAIRVFSLILILAALLPSVTAASGINTPKYKKTVYVPEFLPTSSAGIAPQTDTAIVTAAPPENPYTAENEPEVKTLVISFIGDCLLASELGKYKKRNFNTLADKVDPSYFFAGVYSVLSEDDFTVGNCENVFTDEELEPIAKNENPGYWYRSKKKNAAILSAGSVEIVSIANNHTPDYGKKGLADTKAALEEAGVIWGNSGKPVVIEKYGVRIGLYLTNMWALYRAAEIGKEIKKLSKVSDYQVIYYHGGTERVYTPDEWKVTASKRLIDYGADLVIGNHPHVIQPMEEYNGHEIVHSLGNFIFGGSTRGDKVSIIYQKILYIKDGKIIGEDSEIIPIVEYTGSHNLKWQPYIMDYGSSGYKKVIDFMHGERSKPR